ncbi:MAG: VWA domain-containing protein, partial [bacterium]|nr:VWA domain-containing protein [bacterium]
GKPQRIVTFAHGNVPFTAILLIDASFSMEGTKLESARRGARIFVAGMKELDELRLMVFSDRLVTASPFSHPTDSLAQAVEAADAEGGTAVNDFLFQALCELEQRQGRRVVLVLSDGNDVHSVLGMDAVREIARRSQAQIYWLRLREGIAHTTAIQDTRLGSRREVIRYPRSHGRVNSWRGEGEMIKQRKTLERTVEESGGRVIKIDSVDVVEAAFREVLSELRDQYALGYYPQPRRNDRSWRELRVTVTAGLKARTREGYIDW